MYLLINVFLRENIQQTSLKQKVYNKFQWIIVLFGHKV